MISFNITEPKTEILPYLQEKIDNLTKPKGALGMLEALAKQVGQIQQTLSPSLENPHHLVFAADHGIAAEGVSPSPQEVTRQMVLNFWGGGAGVNFLARQHGFVLKIVDAGVNYDFDPKDPIVHRKIRKSTSNYLYEPAMSTEELEQALRHGAEMVEECHSEGCNIISFGEMGITNTSSSALWLSLLAGVPLKDCIGAGCDHTGDIVEHKHKVLSRALENYKGDGSVLDVMRYFGGFEMVMAVGAMLKAAELKMIVVVDGFIMSCCALAASRLYPEALNYFIFGHQGDEAGHKLVLQQMNAKPILHLDFRLGEGTGAICAYPIIDSAVRMINEMNSFQEVKVSKYF